MAEEVAGDKTAGVAENAAKQSVTGVELLGFVLGECAGFLRQLQQSFEVISKTGKLPPPLPPPTPPSPPKQNAKSRGKGKEKSKKILKEAKPKRKPTAYNLYMAKKLEQLKAGDAALTHMQAFRAASESWSQMSEEEKKLVSTSMLAEAARSPTEQQSPPALVPALLNPEEKKRKKSIADNHTGNGGAQAVSWSDGTTDGEGKRKKKKKKRDKEQVKAFPVA